MSIDIQGHVQECPIQASPGMGLDMSELPLSLIMFFSHVISCILHYYKRKKLSHNPVKNLDILAHSFSSCGLQHIS